MQVHLIKQGHTSAYITSLDKLFKPHRQIRTNKKAFPILSGRLIYFLE